MVRLRILYAADSGSVVSYSFEVVPLRISHNFVYGVEGQAEVDRLLAWTRRLGNQQGGSPAWEQRSMVAYWMNEFNRLGRERMGNRPSLVVGTKGGTPLLNSLQEDMLGGAPVRRGGLRLDGGGGSLGDGWFKMTSPLRRRVDLWNQALFVSSLATGAKTLCSETSWLAALEERLGEWGDTIRTCSKLERCVGVLAWARNHSGKALQGNVLGMRSKGGNGEDKVKWLVFVEAIGWMTWVLSPVDLVVGSVVPLRVWYFEHEFHTRKKVRLEVVC
jgi:hypothetical protein